jgi:hypothetical protein
MTRDIINQVRELLGRNLDVFEISNRLGMDIDTVKLAIHVIREIIT